MADTQPKIKVTDLHKYFGENQVLKGKVPELLAAFNAGLKSLKDSGEYDTIVKKYTEA